MAPYPVRQLLVWSLPSIAVLLSYLWYKKKRIGLQSDSGGSKPIEDKRTGKALEVLKEEEEEEEILPSEEVQAQSTPAVTPKKIFNRSLSGVETSPINIVYPPSLRSSKSSPVVITDEDLDVEIEKVKSMKNGYSSPSTISAHLSKTPSPTQISKAHSEDGSFTPRELANKIRNCSFNTCEATITCALQEEACKPTIDDLDAEVAEVSTSSLVEKDCPSKQSGSENTTTSSQKSSKTNNTTKQDLSKSSCKTPSTASKKNKKNKENRKQQEKTSNSKKNMAQKDVAVVEEKISALKLTSTSQEPHNDATHSEKQHEIHRQNSGRDSANHSPSDVMLASPSLSSISDNHSEGSNDSGKGGSDLATPPASRTPNSVQMNANVPIIYEFVIPQNLVGKLIGRQGCFVQHIKDKTNAYVFVRKHPTNNRLKVCSIEGTQAEIDRALKMIREKFPLKKYSDVTLKQVTFAPTVHTVPLIPDHLYLKLVEGINNDTILSCMVAPNHLFMQQPTHPSFPNLNVLSSCMNGCYNETDSPMLPTPVPANTVCAAFSIDSWYRAMILSADEETNTSYVKFLDYGGYAYVENQNLRQIRQDFMLLPFQGAECFLSNIKSKNEDGSWPEQSYNLVANITKGSIIYTQVADYTPDGIPLVLCYVVTGPRDVVFLNQKLVDEGFAEWVPFENSPSTETTETAAT